MYTKEEIIMKSKLAVIFPGIGYHSDKPLLYYSKKILKDSGFEILDVPYGNLPKDDKLKSYNIAKETTEKFLSNINFEIYDQIFFVSKSIGTMVSGYFQKEHNLKVKNIYFTPVNESLEVLDNDGIVFSGTNDSWVNTDKLKEVCKKRGLKLNLFDEANHSLETDEVLQNINIQYKIAKIIKEYI